MYNKNKKSSETPETPFKLAIPLVSFYARDQCAHASRVGLKILAMLALAAGWMSLAQADEAYFNANVAPKLAQDKCATCHVANFIRPRVFEYRELLPYVAMGTSPENNVLIAKMTNARHLLADVASHPGGQRCQSIDSEPCLSFQTWWKNEFGQ
jgi:hypothetical protein